MNARSVDPVPCPVQSLRPQFQRYLKHIQLALEDNVSLSIAREAGILMDGSLQIPLSALEASFPLEDSSPAARIGSVRDAAADSIDERWDTKQTLEVLNLVRTDIGRLDGPLRELRPKDRCGWIQAEKDGRLRATDGDSKTARGTASIRAHARLHAAVR